MEFRFGYSDRVHVQSGCRQSRCFGNLELKFIQQIKIPNLTVAARKKPTKRIAHDGLKRSSAPTFSQSLHNSLLKYFVSLLSLRESIIRWFTLAGGTTSQSSQNSSIR